MRYPENSEYEYLCWLIYCDRLERERLESEPLYDQHFQAYRRGDRAASDRFWGQAYKRKHEITEQSRRREDIVAWLSLDAELRQEGETYPDVYEAAGWARCVVDVDF